jgi:hypothetical protein
MDNIVEPNEHFPFSKLSLTIPSGVQGGAYFTKIQFHNKPLYIQTTKSLTRQGIVKSGKKYYCDLMFDKNAEELIQWFEHLEETCQQLIYSKSETWFQTALEKNDIESAFTSPIRVYKSGKYYLVRVNIRTNSTTGDPSIKIYDENEIPLGIQDIQPETNIISILEIQGIKFTHRNFQLEIELKQMMVLNEPIFDHCLIKKSNKEIPLESRDSQREKKEFKEESKEISNEESKEDSKFNELETFDPMSLIETIPSLGEETKVNYFHEDTPQEELNTRKEDDSNTSIESYFEEAIKKVDEINSIEDDDLKEYTIQVDTNMDSVTLKKPNEVYYQLYREARKKAKEAKKTALIAYLEAKNIKKTYLLENINDSDEEFDTEMDEFTENEIEDLEI